MVVEGGGAIRGQSKMYLAVFCFNENFMRSTRQSQHVTLCTRRINNQKTPTGFVIIVFREKDKSLVVVST